jgi:protein-S-isoprenylcysteine O-methyltransferase Ste14
LPSRLVEDARVTPLIIGYVLVLLLFAGLPWATRVNPKLEIDRRGSRRTGMVLGLVHVIALVVPLLAASSEAGPRIATASSWLGVVLMLASLALQQWAQRSLGECFTLALQASSDQPLCSSGPYARVRHPAYLAQIALWIGLAVASGSIWAILSVSAIVIAGYAYRIVAEESMMRAHLGHEFTDYVRRTNRLIPYFW